MSKHHNIHLTYEYTYSLLRDAMRLAGRQINSRRPSVRRLSYAVTIGSGVLIVLYFVVMHYALNLDRDVVVAILGAYVLCFVVMMLYWNWLVAAIAWDSVRLPLYAGKIEMEMASNGVTLKAEHTDCVLRWSAVEEVVDLRDGLGLFCGCCIYPIPDKALPSELTRDQVRDRISEWREAAE